MSDSEARFGYREFAPPAILAHIVDAFWSLSPPQTNTQTDALNYRVLPDGCVDLFCRFQRSTGSGQITNPMLMIYGPTDQFELVEMNSSVAFVGVRFKPGEAFSILHSSPSGLFRTTIEAQDYSGDFSPLVDQLSTCRTTQQALNLLQGFVLEQRLNSSSESSLQVREAVRLIFDNEGRSLRITDVADKLGVSERTLRRNITRYVGLSPKMLSRILRFQRTLVLLRSNNEVDLCTTALNSGYADQSHLGREFRELAGLPPAAYLRSLSL